MHTYIDSIRPLVTNVTQLLQHRSYKKIRLDSQSFDLLYLSKECNPTQCNFKGCRSWYYYYYSHWIFVEFIMKRLSRQVLPVLMYSLPCNQNCRKREGKNILITGTWVWKRKKIDSLYWKGRSFLNQIH